jgi:hypothetical protein
MKPCKCCRSLMTDGAVAQSYRNLEKLLTLDGFVPKTIHDVVASVGPLCEKCLQAWAKDLRSK